MRLLSSSFLYALLALQSSAQGTRSTVTPTATGSACASISSTVAKASSSTILVGAEVAYNCLMSVPFSTDAASLTVTELQKMLQYQSTLAFLKSPPTGYANPPVDILAGLSDIAKKVTTGQYQNQYTFEAEISQLLGKAYDGHLNFLGMVYFGALKFRRDRAIGLISASQDSGIPKIYCVRDIEQSAYQASAITKINDEDAVSFLQKEADLDSHHDADARWNTLFFQHPKDAFGAFNTPRLYPGKETKITFENGTTLSYQNAALVAQPDAWGSIRDGSTFYQVIVTGTAQTQSRRSLGDISRDYVPVEYLPANDLKKTTKLRKRELPDGYPTPFIVHSADTPPISGFFIDTPKVPGLAVVTIPTFQTDTVADSREFQKVLEQFLQECRKRGSKRIIVDVRSNPGGKLFLGYEVFKQFFPTTEPFGGSRFRSHTASDLYGTLISGLPYTTTTAALLSTPFNYKSWLDENLKSFTSWNSVIGKSQFNNDNFTALLRYNLSDPQNTVPTDTGLGITLTGYNGRASIKDISFDKDSIVILSDGICASTCSLFIEFMQQQAGVRTFAVGGRPSLGPMQSVGGTKGSRVLTYDFFQSVSVSLIQNLANTRTQARQWQSVLPIGFGINVAGASVNFQDNIRENQKSQGIPTQFLNDTAHCRIFYNPNMYFNATALWASVADAMWGGSGGTIDEGRCVKGSSAGEQLASNPSAPVGGRTSATSTGSKAAAAAGVIIPSWSWTPVIITCILTMSGFFGAGTVLI